MTKWLKRQNPKAALASSLIGFLIFAYGSIAWAVWGLLIWSRSMDLGLTAKFVMMNRAVVQQDGTSFSIHNHPTNPSVEDLPDDIQQASHNRELGFDVGRIFCVEPSIEWRMS